MSFVFVHLIAMCLSLKYLRVINVFEIHKVCNCMYLFYFLQIQYLMTEITFILIFNINSVFLERLRSIGIHIRLLSHCIPIDFRTTRKPMHAHYTCRKKKMIVHGTKNKKPIYLFVCLWKKMFRRINPVVFWEQFVFENPSNNCFEITYEYVVLRTGLKTLGCMSSFKLQFRTCAFYQHIIIIITTL